MTADTTILADRLALAANGPHDLAERDVMTEAVAALRAAQARETALRDRLHLALGAFDAAFPETEAARGLHERPNGGQG